MRGRGSMSHDLTVTTVRDGPDLAAVKELCTDFLQWNRARYARHNWLIDRYYDPEHWAAYLCDLPSLYAPSAGDILLARLGSDPVGCVMMRSPDASTCEMKHLFVHERARGSGVGFRLCETLMVLAAERGLREMRLETGSLNDEAAKLYGRLGFVPCAPWNDYPDEVRALLRSMKVDLTARSKPDYAAP